MSTEPRPKKLLEQVDDAIRLMHYSPRTGETYVPVGIPVQLVTELAE